MDSARKNAHMLTLCSRLDVPKWLRGCVGRFEVSCFPSATSWSNRNWSDSEGFKLKPSRLSLPKAFPRLDMCRESVCLPMAPASVYSAGPGRVVFCHTRDTGERLTAA